MLTIAQAFDQFIKKLDLPSGFEAPIRLRALRLDCLDRVALGSFRQNAFGCGVLSEIAPHRIAQ